jgi:rhodanese-related sulfurtransferase
MKPDNVRLPQNLTPNELQRRLDAGERIQLVDVREIPEFAAGRLSGAQLVPLGEIEKRSHELDRSRPLVLVCRSGKRAAQARDRLAQLGFGNLACLEGGLAAWESAGLPVEKDEHAPWSLERQVRFALGLFVLLGLALSLRWPAAIVISWLIGIGMVLTSIIDWCGMALILAKAPWNRRSKDKHSAAGVCVTQ